MEELNLTLKRIAKRPTYTIGRLYVDGKYFCDTLEDTDRGLSQSLPESVNKAKKLKGRTAIPTGKYRVTLDVKSQKYSQVAFYNFCNGCVPRLLNVPAYDGILIHVGNTERDTEGCILVGENKAVGKVLNSRETFLRLYAKLQEAKGGKIYITIE